jgi:hypothetical protein
MPSSNGDATGQATPHGRAHVCARARSDSSRAIVCTSSIDISIARGSALVSCDLGELRWRLFSACNLRPGFEQQRWERGLYRARTKSTNGQCNSCDPPPPGGGRCADHRLRRRLGRTRHDEGDAGLASGREEPRLAMVRGNGLETATVVDPGQRTQVRASNQLSSRLRCALPSGLTVSFSQRRGMTSSVPWHGRRCADSPSYSLPLPHGSVHEPEERLGRCDVDVRVAPPFKAFGWRRFLSLAVGMLARISTLSPAKRVFGAALGCGFGRESRTRESANRFGHPARKVLPPVGKGGRRLASARFSSRLAPTRAGWDRWIFSTSSFSYPR